MESFPVMWYSILLVNVQLLVLKVDASITWTLPPPQRGPLSSADSSSRTTVKKLDGTSPELRLEWNFTLSGESLTRVEWSTEGASMGRRKASDGTVRLSPPFDGHFDISASDLATLIIYNKTAADGKKFTCTVVTSERNWIDEISVVIQVPAKVTEIRGEQTVREGGNLQLTCIASGKPEPNVTWTKEKPGNQGNAGVVQEEKMLTLTNISRSYLGTFKCTAFNGFREAHSRTVYVNVTYPAKIFNTKTDYIVGVQQSVTLDCEAEGNPPPTYNWTPCDTEQVCNKNTLVISEVLNDTSYTCRVANALGLDSRAIHVYIGGDVINITVVITSERCTHGNYNNKSLVLEKFKELLNSTFAGKLGYERVLSIAVRCGSINVDLALKFNSITKEQDVITTLYDALRDGKLGEFSVSSIKGTRYEAATTSSTTTSTRGSSEGTDWWVFFLIGLGVAFVVGLVVGICCWKFGPCCLCNLCTKNKASKEVHSDGGQDVEMEVGYSSADHQYAAAGPNANYRASTQSSVPPVTYEVANRRSEGRRGNGAGGLKEPPPQYAMVDMTKKKKTQTPKPGELQYAELGELTGPRQKAVLPRVSGTDTVYSDIRT